MIAGGEAVNSVPQSVRAEIDIRLTARVDTQDVLSDIRACAADCEGITTTDASWSVGTAEPINSSLVEAVTTVAADVTDNREDCRRAMGGGDAKKLRNAGIPTVEFAPGTETVHAIDEYATVDALVGNAVTYTRIPYAFISN